MKVIHVNICASSGSTGKIVSDISTTLLKYGHESLICYGANETIFLPNYFRFCNEIERKIHVLIGRITGIIYGCFGLHSTKVLIKRIKDFKPDVVHIHCINGGIVDIYKLFEFLSKNHYKTILTLHAEFMYTGTCGHSLECMKFISGCYKCDKYKKEAKSLFDNTSISWKIMSNSYKNFDDNDLLITSVSPWLKSRAIQSSFLKRFQHDVVFNGLNDSIFRICDVDSSIPQKFESGKKLCIFVSPTFDVNIDSFKGGWFFVELALRLPHVQFAIISIYSKEPKSLPENVKFLGRAKNQEELAQIYNLADLSILTSKRETFSMVTAESLCCGTPVVGFKAGGPESIAIPEYSSFVEYGDMDSLEKEVLKFLNTQFDSNKISSEAHQKYSKSKMTDSFLKIYKHMLGE